MYTDPIDHASHLADVHNEESIKRVQRAGAPQQVPNPDGSYPIEECEKCGTEIPEARLRHGFIRCVTCQEAIESRKKFFR